MRLFGFPLSLSLADFLTQFYDTLMSDLEAVVDWQITDGGFSYSFRVALPYISSADMLDAPRRDLPELSPGGSLLTTGPSAADTEHFCPITYLAYRRNLGCYSVQAADRAARKLRLPEAVRDLVIAAADQPHTQDMLYWQLKAIFQLKERQILSLQCFHSPQSLQDLCQPFQPFQPLTADQLPQLAQPNELERVVLEKELV